MNSWRWLCKYFQKILYMRHQNIVVFLYYSLLKNHRRSALMTFELQIFPSKKETHNAEYERVHRLLAAVHWIGTESETKFDEVANWAATELSWRRRCVKHGRIKKCPASIPQERGGLNKKNNDIIVMVWNRSRAGLMGLPNTILAQAPQEWFGPKLFP